MSARLSIGDRLIFVAFAGLGITFWYLRIVVPASRVGFFSTDLYAQIYPMEHRAFEWMSKGIIPLWNPFQYCGHPFLAALLYGIFYPLNFPFLLLSTEVAIEVVIILHLIAASVFTYLYARAIRLSRPAAVLAAVTFTYSGFFLSQAMWFTPACAAAVWLPVALLGVERIIARRRPGGVLLLAIAVAMPILAGWLQTWVYMMYATAGYASLRLLALTGRADRRKHLAPAAALLVVGTVLGVCLASVQVLPTVELWGLGPRRSGGLSLEQALSPGPTSPARLIAAAVGSDPGYPRFAYAGILALVLMPIAVLCNVRRKRVMYFAALAFLSVAVALTVFTPLFGLYRVLPAMAWFRAPQRILFLYAFAGGVLSAVGLDEVARRRAAHGHWKQLLPAGIAGVISILWIAFGGMSLRGRMYVSLGTMLLWGISVCAGRMRGILVAALITLVTVDLFVASRTIYKHPYHSLERVERERDVFRYIKAHQRLYRTYIHRPQAWIFGEYSMMPKQGTLREIYSITDYEPLSLDRYAAVFSLLGRDGTQQKRGNPFSGRLNAEPDGEFFGLLDLMSVRYIIAPSMDLGFRRSLKRLARWQEAFTSKDGAYVVYENERPLFRAYVANRVRVAKDAQAALHFIGGPSFNPRRETILEGPEGPEIREGSAKLGGVVEARIVSYRPTRVVVEADSEEGGYLVLTDTFYPGWRTKVDGREKQIYVANYLFRAVEVPRGRHTVVFSYEPASFVLGACVTLLTAGCFLVWAGWRRRRPRRPCDAPAG